jgi:thiol:disulfide interchange protein DsbG
MKNASNFRPVLLTFLLASTLAVSACKDAAEKPGAAPAASTEATEKVSIPAIATQAKGFTVGSPMSARTVYVFFDSQCPHCAVMWEQAKPLKSQAKFVWIPVGLLNASSTSQGAALLAAADPVAAMDAHEASMKEKKGGITASGSVDAQRAEVEANTKLFNRFKLASVPTIVGKHAVSGEMVVLEGSLPTASLATALGLQVPAGN